MELNRRMVELRHYEQLVREVQVWHNRGQGRQVRVGEG